MKTLIVQRLDAFGEELFRPICDTSKMFAKLLDQKTLTKTDLEIIEKLGFEVRVRE